MSTVLVTGTPTGIGQSTANHLARNGQRVFAIMRNPAGAAEFEEIVREESLPITICESGCSYTLADF